MEEIKKTMHEVEQELMQALSRAVQANDTEGVTVYSAALQRILSVQNFIK